MPLRIEIVMSLFLAAVCAQEELDFKSCGEPGKDAIKSITAFPCDSQPCRLKKGDDVSFQFRFVSDENSERVRLEGTATGPFQITISIPGLEPDLCKAIQCPLTKGKEYTGSMKLNIPRIPLVSKVLIRTKVFGDSGEIACFEFPVVLV